MKKVLITAGVLVALFGLGAYGFSRLPDAESSTVVAGEVDTKIMFSEVYQQVASQEAVLYDVRTPEEFATNNFKGAINYPLQALQAGQLPPTNKDTKMYIYCNSGNRSGQAKQLLENAGYTNVVDLGGLSDVQSVGGTLITY